MPLSFLTAVARRRRQLPRGVPCDLSPHLLRDIGLDPLPERPRLPFHQLW